MKIVLAPDKFKGSLTGIEFCNAVEEGVKKVFPKAEIIKLPLADGGDGTIEVLEYHLKGKRIKAKVRDPLNRPIDASYLFIKSINTAFIEMAEASGMKLLIPEEQNCFVTSSFGTGEIILDAILKGARTIILGIGGSATNDCGIGMASALGFKFINDDGIELSPIGKNLSKIRTIDTSQVLAELKNIEFKVACDVTNPLYGPNGAAVIYGPQKGASEAEIVELDKGLKHIANIFLKQFTIDVQKIKGAGAAGGIGAGSKVFFNAQLLSGIELIKEMVDFDHKIIDADWIITGEGKLDSQTLSGKTISGIIKSAQQQNIPVTALCGSVSLSINDQEKLGLTYVNSIVNGVATLDEALKASYENLVNSAYNFAKILK